MKYNTDIEVREQIDLMLQRNATIQSNLGNEHSKNCEERREARAEWRELLREIKALDPEFGRLIALQDN
tara:strand:+ start:11338 stop:11544 length:207 start_codon:yes stop_codon:yes gene_type:complete